MTEITGRKKKYFYYYYSLKIPIVMKMRDLSRLFLEKIIQNCRIVERPLHANFLGFMKKKSTKFAIIFFPYRKYGNSSLLEAEEEREKLLGEHFYSHLSVSGSPNTMCPKNPEKSAIIREVTICFRKIY